MGGSLPVTPDTEKTKPQDELDASVAYQYDRQEKDEPRFKHVQQCQQLSLYQRSEFHTHELKIEMLR